MRYCALLVMLVACGDNQERAVPFDAVSGTRLRVERYMFDDGTSLPAGTGYFDGDLHVHCVPTAYVDGAVRCVPVAEDALFSDAECVTAIGRGMLITKPSYFVGHETVRQDEMTLVSLPAHVYRAGEPIAAPGEYYERVDGMCLGPMPTPSDYVYYQLTGEVDVVELHESIVGDDRLSLRVRTSTDGSITPLAIFDRELMADCEPAARTDGPAVCEPVYAPTANLFADATCAQPAVAIIGSPQPLVARLEPVSGCPTYRALGAELTTPLYRLEGTACVGVARVPLVHYYPLEGEATLAPLERTVEASARRLHRIIAATDSLVAYGQRLVDTATRAECARYPIGEIERCLPTNTVDGLPLFALGCTQRLRGTQAPVRSCDRPQIAVSTADEAHASTIGDLTNQAVYTTALDGTCRPYRPPLDQELRALGPPLPDDTFLAARPYGER
jgi:hypothetical protein